MRILVVAPSWIGDALLAQPLFARLLVLHPSATIDAIAPPWTAPVLRRMPEISVVIDAPIEHGALRLVERWRLARQLAARSYDRAVVLPNSFKSALTPWLARIPVRIGFIGEQRYGVLNVLHRLDPQQLPLMAERYAKLAEAPRAMPHRPLAGTSIRIDPVNRARTLNLLALNVERPIVAFCPGAEYGPAKRWPVQHFTVLARALTANGRQVWLFGGPKDQAITREIKEGAGEACTDLAGRTDLAGAIDLMSYASAVVSNDSGLMHVAAAIGRPLVALYGSSSPAHTPPLAPDAQILSLSLACSPCYARECPLGHFRCLNDLDPIRVMDAIGQAEKSTNSAHRID
ncbi:MAG: lipopolysaccharide heptosyltransferase II [Betaproteobacteria bacterium]|nr:lipopolysaccharide heptosyltransferase II [Betaproteobacteria bacterium]